VAQVVAAPSIASFTASPASVPLNGSTTLTAVFTGGTGVVDQGIGPVQSGVGIATGPLPSSRTFTLAVTNAAGTSTEQALTVAAGTQVEITAFTATPATLTAGETSQLRPTFVNATAAAIDLGVGPVASGVDVPVSPGATTTYTLTAQGPGGPATRTVTVTVVPAPAVTSFSAAPPTVVPGGSSVLTALFSGGTGAVDQGIGPVQSGVGVPTGPLASSRTYTLTVTNPLGRTATSTTPVTVLAPPAGLAYSANPATYVQGQAIPPNTPSSSGGPVASYGISPALPGGLALDPPSGVITGTPTATSPETTYVVTATNAAGSATANLTLRVVPPGPVVTAHPAPAAGVFGGTASFTVAATGSGPLAYQWERNGVEVPGATAATWVTPALTGAYHGSAVRARVTDAFGTQALSNPATLTVTQVWRAAGAMSTPRTGHTATLLPTGKVLLAGGHSGLAYQATAELHDPATGAFSATGSPATGRVGHTATLLGNGKVLVAGGNGSGGYLATAELYDPATGLFSPTGAMAAPRGGHTAVLLPGGKVLVAGGYDGALSLATAELFDPATGLFTPTGGLGTPRLGHTAVLLQDGKVLVAGGRNGTTYLASAERYDPATGLFTPAGAMAGIRSGHSATLLASGKVLVAGGTTTGEAGGSVATAELYDPAGNSFSPAGSLALARAGHTATLLGDGKVLVAGGANDAPTATSERYDPALNLFQPADTLASPRLYATATALPGGKVFVAGGLASSSIFGILASAERWEP
jgi:hypothetical protein